MRPEDCKPGVKVRVVSGFAKGKSGTITKGPGENTVLIRGLRHADPNVSIDDGGAGIAVRPADLDTMAVFSGTYPPSVFHDGRHYRRTLTRPEGALAEFSCFDGGRDLRVWADDRGRVDLDASHDAIIRDAEERLKNWSAKGTNRGKGWDMSAEEAHRLRAYLEREKMTPREHDAVSTMADGDDG